MGVAKTMEETMKKTMTKLAFTFLIIIFILAGCKPLAPTPPKTVGFDSSTEMLDNPDVITAIDDSGFEAETGNNPPNIVGDYNLNGNVIDASKSSMIGMLMRSEIEFYNQHGTLIDMKETVGSQTAYGTGSFINGQNNNFTIYQEATQDVYGYDVTVVAMMSGTLDYSGNISGQSLSVITDVGGYPDGKTGGWWQGNITLTKQSSRSIQRSFTAGSEELESLFNIPEELLTK